MLEERGFPLAVTHRCVTWWSLLGCGEWCEHEYRYYEDALRTKGEFYPFGTCRAERGFDTAHVWLHSYERGGEGEPEAVGNKPCCIWRLHALAKRC